MLQTYEDRPSLAGWNTLASPLVKLVDYTASEAAVQIDVDVSGIDFTEYHQIFLYVDPNGTKSFKLRFNDISNGYVCAAFPNSKMDMNESAITYISENPRFVFYPVSNTKIYLTVFCSGSTHTAYDFQAPVTWQQLKKLTIFADSNMAAGLRLTLCGM